MSIFRRFYTETDAGHDADGHCLHIELFGYVFTLSIARVR